MGSKLAESLGGARFATLEALRELPPHPARRGFQALIVIVGNRRWSEMIRRWARGYRLAGFFFARPKKEVDTIV